MRLRIALLLLMLGCCVLPLGAEDKKEEKPQPKPDLWAAEIDAPEGIAMGAENQVKVIVENLVKDTEVPGPIKVELVVIQGETGDRMSYFAEVDSVKAGKKREALFTGVAATNKKLVRFLAIVDPEKVVEESNEDNNRRLYQVRIKQPEVTNPSPSPSPEPEATPDK